MRHTAHTIRTAAIAVALAAASGTAHRAASPPEGTILARITGTDLTSLPSPEASAPARHIEHSIDYSTGKASIAIPLHVYSTGKISVPVTLRGQTGAVKVDDDPGNIGKGWELDCGGFVSRSIVGMPDSPGKVDVRESRVTGDVSYLESLTRYTCDSHYDRYTYMAGGYSGSFLIKGAQIVRLTDDDCKIELLPGGIDAGFQITTPDGTRYRYDLPEYQGYDLTTMTCSAIPNQPGYSSIPCMWRPGSVTDRTGTDTVTFDYHAASDCRRYAGGKVYSESVKNSASHSGALVSASFDKSETKHTYTYTGRHILKKISGRAGDVVFTKDTENASNPIDYLTGFSVVSNAGKTVRKVSFSHAAYGSGYYNRNILLKGYEVTAGDTLVDCATFGYYNEGGTSTRKDFYGYCNQGVCDYTLVFLNPNPGGASITPGVTFPYDHITDIENLYLGQGYLRVFMPNYDPPCESVIYVHNDTVMTNPFRKPHPQGVLQGALRTIRHASGTVTEFEYEAAASPEQGVTIGLRLVRETVTDLNTGSVRERTLAYAGAKASFDFSRLNESNFIAVSGITGYESLGSGPFKAPYTTTGVTLTTCNRFPGASPENAVVYHGKVTESISGTGLASPVVTEYEYDLTGVHGPEGTGGSSPSVSSQAAREKYAGAECDYSWTSDKKVHRELYGMHFMYGYEKEIIGPRAPLKRMTEYTCENGARRILRVTEIATSFDEHTVTVGYHCEPIVRNIIDTNGMTKQYTYDSTYDFCHFPIQAVVRRAYTDSEKVTEYDTSGNSRTVTSTHTYNNHGADKADNGLPYSTVTSCGGQSRTTTRTYASTRGSGLEGATGAIALPVSVTVATGSSVTEERIRYSNLPSGSASQSGLVMTRLLPSAMVTLQNGVAVDSVSITSYDTYCNPLSASQNGGDPVAFGWGHSGTLLTSVTTGSLTTRYTHDPLVGCTSVTSPGGTVRSFAYRGGRLWKESVAGTEVAEHAYRIHTTDGVNSVTSCALTGQGSGPGTTVRSDAYGNPMVTCLSPSGSTDAGILTLTRSDVLSRPLRQYMPFHGPWTGDPVELESEAMSAYPGDTAPYTASVSEAARTGRTLSVTLGGSAFASYPVRTEYMFNTTDGGALSCRRYTATALGGGSLKTSGYWPKGTLAVTVTADHDGRAVYVFTDYMGRRVLERRTTGGTPAHADTHYVYDDAGNLVFILPPAASAALASSAATWNPATDNTLRTHAYIYTYDRKNRVISRKSPGADETRHWYDLTGSPVFSQDALQKQRGVMSYSFTDAGGRPAVSGECAYSASTVTQAAALKLRASMTKTWGTAFAGYAVQGITLSGAEAHTAIYYDDYSFLDLTGFSPLKAFRTSRGYSPSRASSAGLATGSYSRLLGTEGAELSVSYLDSRERTVRTVTSAMPSGFLVTETAYSNTDRPLTVTTTHYEGGTAVNTLYIERRYDGYDRQSEMTVKVNGTAVTSTADTYSANGRLSKTTFGNPRTRTVSYTHTTRGDLATITSADYTQTLTYSGDSCRNGNIRTSSWKGSDGIDRSYRFTYDGMNRLTRALYAESGRKEHPLGLVKTEGTPDYTESMSYDLWSNPVRIRRHGITEVPATASRGTLRFGLCDDITLTYSGDRLVRADDTAPEIRFSGATDFLDGASKSAEYTYDAAGNMLTDANRGIGAVTYNRLHRPETVGINGDTFGFIYSSAGTLLQRTHHHPLGSLNPLGGLMPLTAGLDPGPPVFDSMTDTVSYCGPFEYSNGSLSRVNFPGGYVSGGVAYHYIHDHQGNVRQVVDATTGKVVQESHYYPGGMLFAESTATYFKPGSANNTYRYGGKELLTDAGLNLSLHGARMYDPALLRFITPDPLRHETPHLSSYLYCAANPVMLIDPTGMIFKYNGTDEEIKMLERYIETLKKSRLFSSYFKHIERSDIEYSIQFGTNEDNMKTPGHYNSTKKAIFINGNNKEYEIFPVIIEETFHIFQELFHLSGLYKTQYNIEYEAKTVMTLIMSEDNSKIPSFMGAVPIGIDLNSDFINMCLSRDMLDRNKYVVNILFCPYETLNKAYVAGGGFFVQSQGDAPDEYLVENVNMTQLLYNLLYEVSLP